MADKEAKAEKSAERKAHDAELERQQAIIDAVAKAHDEDLPKLGGPTMNPGASEG